MPRTTAWKTKLVRDVPHTDFILELSTDWMWTSEHRQTATLLLRPRAPCVTAARSSTHASAIRQLADQLRCIASALDGFAAEEVQLDNESRGFPPKTEEEA